MCLVCLYKRAASIFIVGYTDAFVLFTPLGTLCQTRLFTIKMAEMFAFVTGAKALW